MCLEKHQFSYRRSQSDGPKFKPESENVRQTRVINKRRLTPVFIIRGVPTSYLLLYVLSTNVVTYGVSL